MALEAYKLTLIAAVAAGKLTPRQASRLFNRRLEENL